MTPEQTAYIEKHKLVKLCGYGDDALYQSRWGARTISNILQMVELEQVYLTNEAAKRNKPKRVNWEDRVSKEMMDRHLYCVEQYGCGIFGD